MRAAATKSEYNKISKKLVAAVISIVMMITVTVSVSYAWVTVSSNPVVSGARITIAGGTTILLAPDITETVIIDGKEVTVHYPGAFDDTVSFSNYDSYSYLNSLAGLTPVSTADGISWITASYDDVTGRLKSVDKFNVDNTLSLANLTDPSSGGNYIYLDFWVVSPGSEYKLRVSSDVKSGEGSSVVELPIVKVDENTITGYSLDDPQNDVASSVRIGFLSNNDHASDDDMLYYSRSGGYDTRYRKLVGSYAEPGEQPDPTKSNKFTIYEPNGTLHTAPGVANGDYAVTRPLGYDLFTQTIAETDIRNILTVQTVSEWKKLGEQRQFDQIFQAGVSGMSGTTKDNAMQRFLNDYLQWRVTQYITSGKFFTSTSSLYSNSVSGIAEAAALRANVGMSGATDDVYIADLERNTPRRIRMFIWLEGQDIDCFSSDISVSEFLLNIELAGASS